MKKILSLILALAMMASVLALTASAATELDVKWNNGYAVISPNNPYGFTEVYAKSGEFSTTDVFTVPKAGTQLSWIDDASGFATNSVLVVSNWKQHNGEWVLDYDAPMFVGAGGDGEKKSSVETVSSGKVKYTYVTANDNENLRLCVKGNNVNIKVTAQETQNKGSWLKAQAVIDAYNKAAYPVSLVTGKAVKAQDVSEGMSWYYGYVGSPSHSSYKNQIKNGSYEYIYSSVVTVPKAGTTVYVLDDGSYASSNAAIFSQWMQKGGQWVFKTGTNSPDGYTANQQMVGKMKMYWYTTKEDNENLRMCVHGILSDYGITPHPKVYLAEPEEQTKVTATGALTADSYVNRSGETVNYSIYLPEGYKADENYKVLFDLSADSAVAKALAAEKTEVVLITAAVTKDNASDFVDAISTAYGLHPDFLYFYGEDEIKTACENVFVNSAKDTSGYNDAAAAGEAILSAHPDYYGILDGINMYAMGDSYFGGSSVGKAITWVDQMGHKYGMDFINYGIGGSTMSAFVTNKDPMCIRYKQMEKGKADVILLEGGRNDRSQKVPMGTNDSKDIKTFKGAVNTMIDGMLKTYPDAIIILVTAWYHSGKVAETGLSNVDYANALRDIAEYRNDPRVICLYAADKEATGINMDDARFRAKYCVDANDVSHLNGAGMKLIQPYMEKFIAETLANYKGLTVDGEPVPEVTVETTPAETTASAVPDTHPGITDAAETTAAVDTTTAPDEQSSGGCGGAVVGTAAIVALVGVIGCAITVNKRKY